MLKVPPQLYIVHLALMLSPAFMAATFHFVLIPGQEAEVLAVDDLRMYKIFGAMVAVIGVVLSQIVPRLITKNNASLKLPNYASMKVAQWALVEGAAIATIVVYYLTRDQSMLIPTGVLIAILAMLRPTLDEMDRYGVKN
jgi:hypothetical protein